MWSTLKEKMWSIYLSGCTDLMCPLYNNRGFFLSFIFELFNVKVKGIKKARILVMLDVELSDENLLFSFFMSYSYLIY